jgi:transcription initiation factor TFIIE subunit alpha
MIVSREKISQLAVQIGGELGVQVVEFLLNHGENTSEFLIAEKLEVKINAIRKTLYMLQDANLVNSMRKKDKKKGWYIYYWTFDEIQADVLINKMKNKRINNLKKRLDAEQNLSYYTCKKQCIRSTLERALETNFTCRECEKILHAVDNSKKIKLIIAELEFLEKSEEKINDALIEEETKIVAAA